jgi:ABC-type Co2+ transport system permease subunit
MMAVDEPSSTASLLSALFGTTLAPIAGHYGWKAGFLVGLLHAGLVPNTGITHAGLNLYNNGFAGGFVAATVVPVLDGIRERNEMREGISKD